MNMVFTGEHLVGALQPKEEMKFRAPGGFQFRPPKRQTLVCFDVQGANMVLQGFRPMHSVQTMPEFKRQGVWAPELIERARRQWSSSGWSRVFVFQTGSVPVWDDEVLLTSETETGVVSRKWYEKQERTEKCIELHRMD